MLVASGARLSARSPPRITHLKTIDFETLAPNVTDAASIAAAVEHVSTATGGGLDILANNSGSGYNVPLTDVDLELFINNLLKDTGTIDIDIAIAL
jgi:NAD(P)-dependent dehydrogenase (short-subunit alcohol dehydrogenase family)